MTELVFILDRSGSMRNNFFTMGVVLLEILFSTFAE